MPAGETLEDSVECVSADFNGVQSTRRDVLGELDQGLMSLLQPGELLGCAGLFRCQGRGLGVDVLEEPANDANQEHEDQIEGEGRSGLYYRIFGGQRDQHEESPGEGSRGDSETKTAIQGRQHRRPDG